MVDVTTNSPLMARIDLRGAALTAAALRAVLPRGGVDVEAVLPKVRPIVDVVADLTGGTR
ncbi:Histidinol dehydrogenase [Mycobacterium talmoniae]|uniref:Histidinol dehydrogenase n=1 Tax=Mycobacterium talmoniae TaxID=1858794 RepID=A0A2S8BGD4_9MYCO|nr:Histidinol dehydrogenase [Mycobacterium talmoniae]